MTSLVCVVVFPLLSVTEYAIVYVPAELVSTLHEVVIFGVMSPSSVSSAVAHGSVNVPSYSILSGLAQRSVITGGFQRTTWTVRVSVVVFQLESVTVYSTL